MKKILSFLSVAAICSSMSAVSFPASAENEMVYGTMNIPYADFYRAELQESTNSYEVDAVSSATKNKYKMNGEGQLFEGTYYQENEDGTGSIIGVTYPVAISQNDLDELGSNNYGFIKTDSAPQVFKNVTLEDGKAVFSTVQDSEPTVFTGSVKLSTSTGYGDYLLDFDEKPEDMGVIYGAIIKTTSGNSYAMRHEENIWRGELAWSSGIRTTEVHGNALSYSNYISLMGETIDEVTFITLNGYYSVATNTYVPIKFANSEITIENGNAGTSNTSISVTGFPEDYAKKYYIADNFSISDNSISYTDAAAGSYTITISDNNGKYADSTASFVLFSDTMPAEYSDGSIVKTADASEDDFANFMKNISSVDLNGKSFPASGRGATKIITEDGSIDFAAENREGAVFDGSGVYDITVNSTGYKNALNIKINKTAETTVSADTANNSTTTSTTKTSTDSKTNSGSNQKSSSSSSTDSPKTGDSGVVPVALAIGLLGLTAVFTSKKKSE